MRLSASLHLSPFAPYHWIMYGESMWFDVSPARDELGWRARWSNEEMLCDSYDWFLARRHDSQAGASVHRRPSAQGLVRLAKRLL
jgi:hypothetical protein